MKHQRVSVIISAYNPSHALLDAVNSVLKQTYSILELIIINDASDDDSKKYFEKIQKLDTCVKIKVLNNAYNKGLTKSLIKAIKYADGKYIARLDADDYWLPLHLESCINALERFEYDLVGGDCYILDREDIISCDLVSSVKTVDSFYMNNPIVHSSVVFRKSTYDLVGGYDSSFYFAQDFELWLRFQKHSARIGRLDVKTVVRSIELQNIGEKHRFSQFIFSLKGIYKNVGNPIIKITAIFYRSFIFYCGAIRRSLR